MNREKEWDFIDKELQKVEDEKSLLATFALVVKELAKEYPNNQELGAEVRKLIQDDPNTVSYTHLRAHEDRTRSRMPSSA